MGCDIHVFLEHKVLSADSWELIAEFEINRNYTLFGAIAGVRSSEIDPVVESRGMPGGIDYFTGHRYEDYSGHSATWLTADEIAEVVSRYENYTCDHIPEPMRCILASMVMLEEDGYLSRVVFFFDN